MGFEGITQEESLFGDKSFSEILAMLGTEPDLLSLRSETFLSLKKLLNS
jgi:hypothetical protein